MEVTISTITLIALSHYGLIITMIHKTDLEAAVSPSTSHTFNIYDQRYIMANIPSGSIIPFNNPLTACNGTLEIFTPHQKAPGPRERMLGLIAKAVIAIAIAFAICGSLAWLFSLSWLWHSVCTYELIHSNLFMILISSYRSNQAPCQIPQIPSLFSINCNYS